MAHHAGRWAPFWGSHPFRQGGGAARGRFRRRMFDSGELRLVLLQFLEKEPRHGYDFIRAMEERTGGAYAPSPGVVYPTLTMLEELGHVEDAKAEGPKRQFAITPAGRAYLDEHRSEAEAAMARVNALGVENRRIDSGPVFRAMQNLRSVLRQRLADDAQDKQVLFDVADALDEASRKIERL